LELGDSHYPEVTWGYKQGILVPRSEVQMFGLDPRGYVIGRQEQIALPSNIQWKPEALNYYVDNSYNGRILVNKC